MEKLGFRLLLSLGVRDFDLGPQCEYNELRTLGLTSTSEDHLNARVLESYFGSVWAFFCAFWLIFWENRFIRLV